MFRCAIELKQYDCCSFILHTKRFKQLMRLIPKVLGSFKNSDSPDPIGVCACHLLIPLVEQILWLFNYSNYVIIDLTILFHKLDKWESTKRV